jgi:hypothetical protein
MTDHGPNNTYASPEVDRIMEVLSKQKRRVILHALKQGDTTQLLQGSDAPDDMEIELQHVHLPKLEAAGYIEWNRDTGEIAKGPQFDEIEPFLTLVETHADELPFDWP